LHVASRQRSDRHLENCKTTAPATLGPKTRRLCSSGAGQGCLDPLPFQSGPSRSPKNTRYRFSHPWHSRCRLPGRKRIHKSRPTRNKVDWQRLQRSRLSCLGAVWDEAVLMNVLQTAIGHVKSTGRRRRLLQRNMVRHLDDPTEQVHNKAHALANASHGSVAARCASAQKSA